MSGKKGMMRRSHQDDVRAKIKVSNLLTRLHKYAEGELSDDDISPNRLNAIKLLLSKALPDLSSIEIANKEGEEFRVSRIERVIVRPKHSNP